MKVRLFCRDTAPRDGDLRWLSEEELQRAKRFAFDVHREAYVASHALLRSSLAKCGAGESLQFGTGSHGRPELPGTPYRFNLSRTSGLTVCVVAEGLDVGVDVEDVERKGDTVEVADAFFAPSEARQLRALPVAQQRQRFFELWTLKESYLKARGLGLSIPLDSFAFEPRVDGVRFEADDASQWRFTLLRPTARHQVAVCTRGEAAITVE